MSKIRLNPGFGEDEQRSPDGFRPEQGEYAHQRCRGLGQPVLDERYRELLPN